MRALAERGHSVTVVAQEKMSPARQRLGWDPPSLGPATLIVGPTPADIRQIVHEGPGDTIHCIAGARVSHQGTLIAKACLAARRRMGIISETPDPRGLGGWLRWGKYAWERLSIGRHFDFVLAMGETGVRWFRSCGYPAERVYPFCYVTETVDLPKASDPVGRLRFLFVGQLIDRKGVDVLINAVGRTADVGLDVIGDGPLLDALKGLAETLGMRARVRWLGKMEQGKISPFLTNALAVVLPSRHDGWGAVVNETLTVGTPVICSSACGASDLVRHDWLGTVVPAGDVPALQAALVHWATRDLRTDAQRQRILEWAKCIAGDSVAGYMEAVFRHRYGGDARPLPPWRF